MAKDFKVTFWGTRGSLACPGQSTIKYGGNTSCIEIECGDHSLIFDAGTGLRGLGKKIAQKAQNKAQKLDIFLTHTHLDHIVGIPFFAPLHKADNEINIWAGHLAPNRNLKEALIC